MKTIDYKTHLVHYKDDECTIVHREDGPAMEWYDGVKMWFIDGELHREGSPAIIWLNDTIEYYFKGKRHRADGPAVIHVGRQYQWFIDGVEYTERDYKLKTATPAVSACQ